MGNEGRKIKITPLSIDDGASNGLNAEFTELASLTKKYGRYYAMQLRETAYFDNLAQPLEFPEGSGKYLILDKNYNIVKSFADYNEVIKEAKE
jgi:hypothetical protein